MGWEGLRPVSGFELAIGGETFAGQWFTEARENGFRLLYFSC